MDKASSIGSPEITMLVVTTWTRDMDMAKCFGRMVLGIKGTGRWVSNMDLEPLN